MGHDGLPHAGPGRPREALGILLMLGAGLLFALNDVLGKWLVASYPVGQVMVLRCLAALVVLAPFAWAARRALPRPGMQVLRAAIGALESAAFYAAIGMMPLADAMTYWMAAPIFVTALAVPLFGERVGTRGWALVLLGFAGVVLALGAALDTAAAPTAVALCGALLFALFLLATRGLRETPDVLLATAQMAGGLAVGMVLLLPGGWVAPDPAALGLLLLLGVVSLIGHLGVTRSLKLAPASLVVPFQYSFLLWAALFGWLVWGDVPGPQMALGAALIVLAGVLLAWRRQGG